jgi:RNA polymerase sigma-70 factor (ECF subfamily)
MRNIQSDEELLDIFVKSNDEQAFRFLAERYSGLIFHTALRSLNNRTLAEDVAQRVLGVLAKKANQIARGSAPLSAWLHRTTILEAKSARRSEFRHHRKKEALMRTPNDPSHSGDSAWQDALPHLDAAIDTLPESDRHVLLLHFVNELTFPEIARRVGKSAAAVQKQSRRALENLQRILGKRGVTLSLGIITAGLTAEMAKAAPVLLIPALSTLSTLGKTTTSAIVVKKTTVAAIGTTLLLCGIPLARQQASISDLEAKLKNPTDSPQLARTSSRRASSTSLSIPERLARDLKAQDSDVPRYRGAVEYLEELGYEAMISLIKETAVSAMTSKDRILVIGAALATLADRDLETGRLRNPESALNALMDHLSLEMVAALQQSGNTLAHYLRSLSEKDGAMALAWFQEHLDQIRSIPEMRGVSKKQLENEIRIGLSYGLVFSNPTEAVNILRPLPSQNIIQEFEQLVRSVEPSLRKDATGFIQVIRELLPEKDANDVIANLFQIDFDYRAGLFGNVDILLGKYEFSPAETEAIILWVGTHHLESASRTSGGLEKAIPKHMQWLLTLSPGEMDRRVGEALGNAIINGSQTSNPIYQTMLSYRDLGLNDHAIIALLNTVGSKFEMEKVETLAGMLNDRELAARIIDRIKSPATE